MAMWLGAKSENQHIVSRYSLEIKVCTQVLQSEILPILYDHLYALINFKKEQEVLSNFEKTGTREGLVIMTYKVIALIQCDQSNTQTRHKMVPADQDLPFQSKLCDRLKLGRKHRCASFSGADQFLSSLDTKNK